LEWTGVPFIQVELPILTTCGLYLKLGLYRIPVLGLQKEDILYFSMMTELYSETCLNRTLNKLESCINWNPE
jgi:hypothetical protein